MRMLMAVEELVLILRKAVGRRAVLRALFFGNGPANRPLLPGFLLLRRSAPLRVRRLFRRTPALCGAFGLLLLVLTANLQFGLFNFLFGKRLCQVTVIRGCGPAIVFLVFPRAAGNSRIFVIADGRHFCSARRQGRGFIISLCKHVLFSVRPLLREPSARR